MIYPITENAGKKSKDKRIINTINITSNQKIQNTFKRKRLLIMNPSIKKVQIKDFTLKIISNHTKTPRRFGSNLVTIQNSFNIPKRKKIKLSRLVWSYRA